MPCYDSRTDNCGVGAWRDEAEINRLQARCDKLARLLCFISKYKLSSMNQLFFPDKESINLLRELNEWFDYHSRLDNTRAKAQKQKKKEKGKRKKKG